MNKKKEPAKAGFFLPFRVSDFDIVNRQRK